MSTRALIEQLLGLSLRVRKRARDKKERNYFSRTRLIIPALLIRVAHRSPFSWVSGLQPLRGTTPKFPWIHPLSGVFANFSADPCSGTDLRGSAPFERLPCFSGKGRGGCQATEDAPSAGFRRRAGDQKKRVALLDTGGSAQPLLQTPAQFSDLHGSL